MVVESEESFQQSIRSLEVRLLRSMQQTLQLSRASLRENMRILGDPRRALELHAQRIDELAGRLALGLNHQLQKDRALLLSLTSALDHLNPLGILSRGYSITKKLPAGAIVKDASQLNPGDLLSTRFYHGSVLSRVE
jgi:exodeoxyribonuclease VII large subunit